MAQKTLVTRIVLKNGSAEAWTASNPVLLKGEVGLELDTGRYKVGDGTSNWNALSVYHHLTSTEQAKLAVLIEKLNNDGFGKVDDVKVNGSSIVANKSANIEIATLTFSETSQTASDSSLNTNTNVILHKIAKTGKYADILDAPEVIDSAESTSTTDAASANQVRLLNNKINQIPSGKSYTSISEMVAAIGALSQTSLIVATNIYIQTLKVPDFWVYSVESSSVPYTYTTDEAFVNEVLANGSIQVGYYKLSILETNKVDLSDYITTTTFNQLVNRVKAIEEDTTILRETDTFIIDGGTA